MRRNWYDIKAAAAGMPTTISIYDEIGMWGITAKEFIAGLRTVTSDTINLEINSPGGSVFDALAMFNALKTCGKTVNVTVMGIAASAASYLAMVGAKITMPENTFMMVHNPLNSIYGNAADMREMADVLDKIGNSLTGTYVARSGQTDEAMTALLAAESYLSAKECLALGLCDEVTPAVAVKASFEREHLPENIQALFAPVAVDPPPAPPAPPADVITFADQVAAIAAPEYAALLATNYSDMDSVKARIAELKEITALCAVAKYPELAAGLITTGKTLVEARTALCEVLAASDKPVDTTTPISKDPLSGVQPTGLKSADVLAARRPTQGVK